ncbi:MAG: rhodanese-like domain-containing protein [Chloroflexi bacterium]|nr:rhodanese-like domain-containing protein [Chloroflexota bacterium]
METTIDRDELKALLGSGSATIVMTMSAWAFAIAHIPGSLPAASLEDVRRIVSPDADVVVYCTGGACAYSRLVARRLAALGYRRVRRYAGGLQDWTAAGEPLAGALAA